MGTDFNAKKYLQVQDGPYDNYEQALGEIRRGRKTSHWIWYIFPQIAGLGHSSTSRYYALQSLDEARAYLRNDVLKARLIEISEALLAHDKSIRSIVGSPDDMKVRSCMTLFAEADPDIAVFGKVLDRFYDGKPDQKTLELL